MNYVIHERWYMPPLLRNGVTVQTRQSDAMSYADAMATIARWRRAGSVGGGLSDFWLMPA